MTTLADNSGPTLNATRFRAAHEGDWETLDALLRRLEKRSVRVLDADELLALPQLYRTALSSLSVARETSLDRALVTYLEHLCTRAYFQIYGVPGSAWGYLRDFFMCGWPAAVRDLGRELLACVVLTAIGVVVGFMLVTGDPALYYSIVPEGMAAGRDPAANAEALRATIYQAKGQSWLATLAAALFTHNSQVSLFSFALGFAFGVPTMLLLVYFGLTLGAMLAVFSAKGLGLGFAAWLTIHGTTELFAINLAGAAGLRIGLAVAFPGEEGRGVAAVRAGRSTAPAMAGVVCMLLVAGMLEGIGRQVIQSDGLRAGIGLAMLAGWLGYFYLPGRERRAHGLVAA